MKIILNGFYGIKLRVCFFFFFFSTQVSETAEQMFSKHWTTFGIKSSMKMQSPKDNFSASSKHVKQVREGSDSKISGAGSILAKNLPYLFSKHNVYVVKGHGSALRWLGS